MKYAARDRYVQAATQSHIDNQYEESESTLQNILYIIENIANGNHENMDYAIMYVEIYFSNFRTQTAAVPVEEGTNIKVI